MSDENTLEVKVTKVPFDWRDPSTGKWHCIRKRGKHSLFKPLAQAALDAGNAKPVETAGNNTQSEA